MFSPGTERAHACAHAGAAGAAPAGCPVMMAARLLERRSLVFSDVSPRAVFFLRKTAQLPDRGDHDRLPGEARVFVRRRRRHAGDGAPRHQLLGSLMVSNAARVTREGSKHPQNADISAFARAVASLQITKCAYDAAAAVSALALRANSLNIDPHKVKTLPNHPFSPRCHAPLALPPPRGAGSQPHVSIVCISCALFARDRTALKPLLPPSRHPSPWRRFRWGSPPPARAG